MTSASLESRIWLRGRWYGLILALLLVQVGLIFWLTERPRQMPLPAMAEPQIYMTSNQTAQLSGVDDPALFILPNHHGFSSGAWLQIKPLEYDTEPWNEPARPLQPSILQLGASLGEFVRTNATRSFDAIPKPEPQIEAINYLSPPDLEPSQSTLTIEGGLANRPLLTELKLDSLPASEILTNSEVQIAVNSSGDVFSPVLLMKSGSKEADARALTLAKSARFQPLRWIAAAPPTASSTSLSWGKLVFHWHTVALPAAANPPPNK